MNINQDIHCYKDAQVVTNLRAQVLELLQEQPIPIDAHQARVQLAKERNRLERILKALH